MTSEIRQALQVVTRTGKYQTKDSANGMISVLHLMIVVKMVDETMLVGIKSK